MADQSIYYAGGSARIKAKDQGDGTHAPLYGISDGAGGQVDLSAPAFDWTTTTHYALSVDTSVSGNTLGTLLGGTVLADAITAGLQAILVSVETFPIRVRFDDGDPSTVGIVFAKDNGQPYVWDAADFTKIKLVGVGGTATVNVALAI